MSHATTPIIHHIFKWVTQLLQLANASLNESRNYSNEPPHLQMSHATTPISQLIFKWVTQLLQWATTLHKLIAGNRVSELVNLGQWLHVVDGGDGIGYEPGQPEDGGDDDDDRQHQQVQVVAAPFLQPIGSTNDIHW